MAKQAEGVEFEVHLASGNVTGKTWNGKFRTKEVLSFGDQMRSDRLKRDLLGPGPYDGVDQEVMAQATILANLQVRLTEQPEWWAGGIGHADTNLLMEVYEKTEAIIKQHLDGVIKQGEQAQAALRDEPKK